MNHLYFKHSLIALAIAGMFVAMSADARPTRQGSGAVVKTPSGAAVARGQVTRTGANGTVTRRGQVATDGQGNAQGSRSSNVETVNGGSAQRNSQFQRNADGSYSRTGSASASGTNGSAQTSVSISGDGKGNVAGSRQTSATGANGGSYSGSVTAQNGTVNASNTATGANGNSTTGTVSASKEDGVTRTRTCSNAAGETIPCTK